MKIKLIYLVIAAFSLTALVLSGCSGVIQTSNAVPSSQSAMTGKLQILVTDAPPKEDISAIWVTVESVEVHVVPTVSGNATASAALTPTLTPEQEQEGENGNNKNQNKNKNQNQEQIQTTANSSAGSDENGGWQTIPFLGSADMSATMAGTNVQLLDLQGTELALASANFTAGKYTQLRMEVSKVMISFKDGTTEEAKLPSGKLKLVHPFEIKPGETTSLLFDFDALKSVNITGNGQIIFKPVIKLTQPKAQATASANNQTDEEAEELAIVTQSLPDGQLNQPYSEQLVAEGGTAPYTWTLINGTVLPEGLTLLGNTISGTPTTAGEVIFAVQVTDSASPPNTLTQALTITISP